MKTSISFQYVKETGNDFLSLFPHRYDYIWAEHPAPSESPEWKTESRHPLSDRLISQGTYLYGVRFGAESSYCLLDIDVTSVYHPRNDLFAVSRIVAALEPLGLVAYVCCTSSYSGGLHLYFPFQQPLSSWKLAIAVSALLENAGFKIRNGQLEVFPNPKPYIVDGSSLFNAHRLPLQNGSYLLNDEFQPIWSNQLTFVQQWTFAQARNDLDLAALKQILKQVRRQQFCISGKADKFINDLNAEIEAGWTDYGQTNRLLGRITMRSYIFHHVISGKEPLTGKTLVDDIVRTARSLPGYSQWCRHQHEIEKRANEWARCIESSRYFQYGSQHGKFKAKLDIAKTSSIKTTEADKSGLSDAIAKPPTWNQQQSESARDRIKHAIADQLERGSLPARATARFHCLLGYGIGGGSLYRHRDLWHPDHLSAPPQTPPAASVECQLDCVEDASNWHYSTSLLSTAGGNVSSGQAFADCAEPFTQAQNLTGGNFSGHFPGSQCSDATLDEPLGAIAQHLPQGARYIQHVLSRIRMQQDVSWKAAAQPVCQQHRQVKYEAAEAKLAARMQQFLASGDPILVAEALAWVERSSPG